MSPLGLILCFVALVLFLVSLVWIYSTTMTVRRSRFSPWAVLLLLCAFASCATGVILLLA